MKKKKIKLCLTKQLLNMFKLWCEWGISEGQIQHDGIPCTGINQLPQVIVSH